MGPSTSDEALAPLTKIMQRHGATCSKTEFHAAVNVTFHQFESEVYDQEHADMWNSLPQQFALLTADCLEKCPDIPPDLHVLDIGCGTGLASQCLLNSPLGSRIKSIDLLDTSSEMLRQAARRASGWKIPVETHEVLIDALPDGRKYDLIVTCSVLHHVPDLPQFVGQVQRLQAKGGLFLHLQDPNGDYVNDPELRKRTDQFAKKLLPENFCHFTPRRIAGKLYRMLTGKPLENYIYKTNQALLRSGIVSSPLTVAEIYAITDIHVLDGNGISINRMKVWMPDYQCLSQRSYGFYGVLWHSLPHHLRILEERLSKNKAQNGTHIGAAWRLQ